MSRILLVEDNAGIATTLKGNLEYEGHVVEVAQDGAEGLRQAREWNPDLMILDLMLPKIDGFELLRTVRASGNELPVLILSALGHEAQKVLGFRVGADDYVTKPFGLMELLARVGALTRRARQRLDAPLAARLTSTFRFGDVKVDALRREVHRGDTAIFLRPREFDLLLALLRQPGVVISKKELLREVWGYDGEVMSRTVDSHLAELRKKLEDDPTHPRHIRTVRGVGCIIDP